MGLFEICFVGLGLAMDAFAVSVCKGLSMKKFYIKNAIVIALYFGFFQALMPLIGYFLGITFQGLVVNIDHWISFFLLGIIGIKLISEAFDSESDSKNDKIDTKTMLILAVATSIDALAVGITLAFLDTNVYYAVSIIGIITFILSIIGVRIGNKFGDKFQNKAEILGGVILILIGFKILLEHLGLINF